MDQLFEKKLIWEPLENNVNLSEESLTIIIIIVVLISQRKNYINTNPWYNLISYNLK